MSGCLLHHSVTLNAALQVHVILFGIGEGHPEGCYSLRAQPPGGDQLSQETIVAFQDAEDAQRYAGQLEALMNRPSSVVPISPSELLEFCKESGYHCQLETNGTVATPPNYNVDVTDWERSLRLRCGFHMVILGRPCSSCHHTAVVLQ